MLYDENIFCKIILICLFIYGVDLWVYKPKKVNNQ